MVGIQGPGTDRAAADANYAGTDNLEVLLEAKVYANFLRRLIRRNCPASAKSAMDFGAGIGTFSDALKDRNCSVVCVEADPRQRELLRLKGHEVGDLADIADESIDYTYTLNVLEHIGA